MTISKEKFGKYQGKWVALDEEKEEIVASGKDFYILAKKMDKMKKPKKLLMKYIPAFNLYLAPSYHAIPLRES